jgi:hypothetical protein
MLGKPKLTTQDERLDKVHSELLRAVKVSEDEIAAAAGSPDLYEGLRLRIAETGARNGWRISIYERWSGFYASLVDTPRFLVLSAAAAILLLLAASVFVLLPGPTEQIAQRPTQTLAPSALPQVAVQAEQQNEPGTIHPASDQPHRTSLRRRHVESRSTEVATDFLPLTFVDDSRAQESGHVVRVKVPRSALIAFGVPMNMERAGELITADVVIGGDGLARAIRFVQ